jgi:hypothetical protein
MQDCRRAIIGNPRAEHRMGRNYLDHRSVDASNADLGDASYNFRLINLLFSLWLTQIVAAMAPPGYARKQSRIFTSAPVQPSPLQHILDASSR